jgi:hypothetical protein
MNNLRCSRCKEVKDRSNFHPRPSKRGCTSHCKSCRNTKSKEYHSTNRESISTRKRRNWEKSYRNSPEGKRKMREWVLQTKFKITLVEYSRMLDQQEGKCQICGTPPGGKSLAVDHCHSTGAIRGLLCSKCNTGLGMFKDKQGLLKAAIEYLADHGND